jgi:hypothetical protein
MGSGGGSIAVGPRRHSHSWFQSPRDSSHACSWHVSRYVQVRQANFLFLYGYIHIKRKLACRILYNNVPLLLQALNSNRWKETSEDIFLDKTPRSLVKVNLRFRGTFPSGRALCYLLYGNVYLCLSTLKVEAICYSVTSFGFHRITGRVGSLSSDYAVLWCRFFFKSQFICNMYKMQ